MLPLLLSAFVLGSSPASAFKWHSCPAPPLPVYPSVLGATNSPFVHPGHELHIILNEQQVAQSGGFSLTPDGNEIAVVFHSLFGNSVALPPFSASAVSPAVLVFNFPDAATEIGRALAGPVAIRVHANGRLVAYIHWADLVGLPATNDITSLVLQDAADQVVHAALGADGDVWIPASFQGEPMIMPTCPGNFIVPQPFSIAGATLEGASPTGFEPLAHVHEIIGYLGDVVINDTSFYGMLYPQRIQPVHEVGTLGVSICRLNDAMDLVLRLKGRPAFIRAADSPFRAAAQNSSPVALYLMASRQCPGQSAQADQSSAYRDSFGNNCVDGHPSVPPGLVGAGK